MFGQDGTRVSTPILKNNIHNQIGSPSQYGPVMVQKLGQWQCCYSGS